MKIENQEDNFHLEMNQMSDWTQYEIDQILMTHLDSQIDDNNEPKGEEMHPIVG